jgi:hypothetical protein
MQPEPSRRSPQLRQVTKPAFGIIVGCSLAAQSSWTGWGFCQAELGLENMRQRPGTGRWGGRCPGWRGMPLGRPLASRLRARRRQEASHALVVFGRFCVKRRDLECAQPQCDMENLAKSHNNPKSVASSHGA